MVSSDKTRRLTAAMSTVIVMLALGAAWYYVDRSQSEQLRLQNLGETVQAALREAASYRSTALSGTPMNLAKLDLAVQFQAVVVARARSQALQCEDMLGLIQGNGRLLSIQGRVPVLDGADDRILAAPGDDPRRLRHLRYLRRARQQGVGIDDRVVAGNNGLARAGSDYGSRRQRQKLPPSKLE